MHAARQVGAAAGFRSSAAVGMGLDREAIRAAALEAAATQKRVLMEKKERLQSSSRAEGTGEKIKEEMGCMLGLATLEERGWPGSQPSDRRMRGSFCRHSQGRGGAARGLPP